MRESVSAKSPNPAQVWEKADTIETIDGNRPVILYSLLNN
jgi:hypothetical protein